MRLHYTIIAVGFAACTANAQANQVERELLAARDTVWRAWFRNDTSLLRRFLPPAVATLEGRGREAQWRSRNDVLAGSRGFADSKSRFIDIRFENTQIAQSGHSALIQSNYTIILEADGKRNTTRGRATELFVLQGKTWVNPYWQLEEGAAGAGREIQLPDTLGANFAIGDSARKAGTDADYDALVGTWEFRFQVREPDGRFLPSFTGHWTFEKKPDGGLIEDRWRPDDPSVPMETSLYTYRIFDAERKVWQMFGTWVNSGEIQPGLTWSDGTSRFAIQWNRGVLSRIRYLQISPNSFLWRSDRSVDGGKTWLLDASTMEAKRIGK